MGMSSASDAAAGNTEGAQSVRRAVAVLRALAAGQDRGARASEVALQCGLTRATAHRMLQVLVEEGLAERTPSPPRYVIGREASLLGIARSSPLPIRTAAAPFLEKVCRETGDSTVLTLRSGTDSICIERLTGSYPIQVIGVSIGARLPLGVGVGGVVLLAFLPRGEREELIARIAPRLARHRTTVTVLRERIRRAREQGHAFTDAGVIPGTHVLAVPVLSPEGRPLAALSINAMANRLPAARAKRLVPLLRQQADGIGARWTALG
ncbi:Acetate operon repressor (plasmid) [Variovorax sp. SRS16]|nr:Acetate operon repressor [Variovorax sp. SRS16]